VRSGLYVRPWVVTYNVGAGEGTVAFINAPPLKAVSTDKTAGEVSPEQALKNAQRADQRARKQLRLYVVANCLTRMWTLTYADRTVDRRQVVGDVNDWLQRLREHLGENFPGTYVLEFHPEGHGLHVHVALQSRFIDWRTMSALWGHGHVQYSDGNKAIKRVKGKRAKARELARYLTKYMSKGWSEGHAGGDHRYEVTQGFQPGRRRRVFFSYRSAVEWLASQESAGQPQCVWNSNDQEEWEGPPCWAFVWQ